VLSSERLAEDDLGDGVTSKAYLHTYAVCL
jgi:hypothetical protein